MKKKIKHESDFFAHTKKVMGKDRFSKAVKKGNERSNELRLKMARELIGLNQTDLKGLSQPEVSKIEKRKDLKISTLHKYAKALGMKVKITFVSDAEGTKPIDICGEDLLLSKRDFSMVEKKLKTPAKINEKLQKALKAHSKKFEDS